MHLFDCICNAAKRGDIETMELIITRNQPGDVYTVLHIVACGHPKCLEWFLSHHLPDEGIDVKTWVEAIDSGCCECVKLLMQADANRTVFQAVRLPLAVPIEKGNVEMCRLLINYGADPFELVSQNWRDTYLHNIVNTLFYHITDATVTRDMVDFLEFIIRKSTASYAGLSVLIALEQKKQTGHRRPSQGGLMELPRSVLAHIHTFLDHKHFVNYANQCSGKTALINAIESMWILHTPIYKTHDSSFYTRLLDVLLQAGADQRPCTDGMTPLHYAAKHNDCMFCLAYLKANKTCSIDQQDNTGWTALHWAVSRKKLPCVELLVKAGADLHVKDTKGRSPLDLDKETDGACALTIEHALDEREL